MLSITHLNESRVVSTHHTTGQVPFRNIPTQQVVEYDIFDRIEYDRSDANLHLRFFSMILEIY
jgi:hypothetical protein